MWENLEAHGYASPTHAVTKAFELLLENQGGDIRNPAVRMWDIREFQY